MPQTDRDKWNRKYQDTKPYGSEPSPLIAAQKGYLPSSGNAIDVAGGQGSHAVWLAQQGLNVTLADISDVALKQAEQQACQLNLLVNTCLVDLEEEPFPPGPWDVILTHLYLHRPLFPALTDSLAAGGILIVSQPTKNNLLRHQRPPAQYLLDEGELPGLVSDLQVLHYEEGWSVTGRHDALIVAQKPVNSPNEGKKATPTI